MTRHYLGKIKRWFNEVTSDRLFILFSAWLSCHWVFTDEQHSDPSSWPRWVPQRKSVSARNWNLLWNNTCFSKPGAFLGMEWAQDGRRQYQTKPSSVTDDGILYIYHYLNNRSRVYLNSINDWFYTRINKEIYFILPRTKVYFYKNRIKVH